MKQDTTKLNLPISISGGEVGTLATRVVCEMDNKSSVLIEYALFTMSDDDYGGGDPIVKQVRIRNIGPGASKTGSKTFPTGVEKVVMEIKPEGYEKIINVGFADNAEEINAVLED